MTAFPRAGVRVIDPRRARGRVDDGLGQRRSAFAGFFARGKPPARGDRRDPVSRGDQVGFAVAWAALALGSLASVAGRGGMRGRAPETGTRPMVARSWFNWRLVLWYRGRVMPINPTAIGKTGGLASRSRVSNICFCSPCLPRRARMPQWPVIGVLDTALGRGNTPSILPLVWLPVAALASWVE